MARPITIWLTGLGALAVVQAALSGGPANAQESDDATQIAPANSGAGVEQSAPERGWTLDQARAHLKLYPSDAYVQYVALQLARREGRQPEIAQEIEQLTSLRDRRIERRQDIDAFSIFSGSLAVQESLQLDEMVGASDLQTPRVDNRRRIGPPPVGAARNPQAVATVPMTRLEGPTIKSHPWHDMLAGRTPKVSLLSRSIPDDFYFIEFRSVNKLLEAADVSDLWGRRVFNQSLLDAQTQLVNERLRQQLAVEDAPLLRPFYDNFVQGVAVTGSDLFLREGSDVTLLFHVKQAEGFRAQMEQLIAQAQQSRPDAARSSYAYRDVEVVHVATPDRQVYVYSAYPKPELHVRSNSQVAVEQIIDVIRGKTPTGETIVPLGDTEEFQYIRTLMPSAAEEEDGFIYLSDPFIRKLMGPQLRLTESRRLRCYNHLKMIGHAALMYRTERGNTAASLQELATAHCTPGEFGKGQLACPHGGEYALAPDGLTGVCSHHGYASYLTPCCEIELDRVTELEAAAYKNFLAGYNQYWRTFFDPIAIRLTLTPERYRAETIVLPLIDNSIYTGLAAALGGHPEPLLTTPAPQRNIFSLAVRLNKPQLLGMAGMEDLLDEAEATDAALQAAMDANAAAAALQQLALAMLNFNEAQKHFPPAATVNADGKPLLSWRVQVLPYLDDEARKLYEAFHLDEPWNSPHNRQLIVRMPSAFQSSNAELNKAGKTRFVTPVGDGTVFPTDNKPVALAAIKDFAAQTIAILEVEDDDAVIWTKPDDVAADDQTIRKLAVRSHRVFLAAFCDGSVHRIADSIDDQSLSALYTKSGGENVNLWSFVRTPRTRVGPFSEFSDEVLHQLQLGKFLAKGIGNQVAFHAYDSEPLVGFNLSQVVGMAVSSFRGGRVDDDVIWLGMLVGALNSPVYVSIPVADRQIVDEFLDRLDIVANEAAHEQAGGGFFEINSDFYRLDSEGDSPMRGYSVRLGPVKWRFFWQRIGDGLYIASKPAVLKDIAALTTDQPLAGDGAPAAAHAMVRVRPQHWDRALSDFRLGWAENNRQACLKNCGPLHALARALGDGAQSTSTDALQTVAARLYDVHYFCPDGGQYVASPAGEVSCSVHGTARAPRQTQAPAADSQLGRLMQDFSEMTVSLVFLEDGLHAIVDLQRTKASR